MAELQISLTKTHEAKDTGFNRIALICNKLCFHKNEINRFGPILGGVFGTQQSTHDLT
jgi:hypothetical protein